MIQQVHHAGHTLTWEEHSPGEHTLIFIHGYSANRAIWAYEVERLGHLPQWEAATTVEQLILRWAVAHPCT
jgi:hypothetical protein